MSTSLPLHRRVTWLELFYDLVYVVVIRQLTHLIVDEPSTQRLAAAGALAAIIWVAWFNVTAFSNLAGEITGLDRIPVFVSMAGVGVMALGITDLGHGDAWLFVVGYTIARTAMWPLWARNRRGRGLGWFRPFFYGPGLGALWLLSAFLPHPWTFWAWGLLITAEIGLSTARRFGSADVHYDGPHMVERIGLFLMIVLGESVLQIIHALESHRYVENWVAAALGMALLCCLWWLIHAATVERLEDAVEKSGGNVLDFIGGSQLAIVAGLVGVAGGLAGAIEHAHAETGAAHIPVGSLTALVFGLILVVLGVRSLSSKVWAVSLADIELGRLGAVLQAAVVSAPLLLVLWLGKHWPPALVLASTLVVMLVVLARQVMGERAIDRFVEDGGDLAALRAGKRGRRSLRA